MVFATRGLLLSTSRSNITDSSFCCTFSSPRAEKNGLVICREEREEQGEVIFYVDFKLLAQLLTYCYANISAHNFQMSPKVKFYSVSQPIGSEPPQL